MLNERRAIENVVRAILREGGINLGAPARASSKGACERSRATVT